MFYIHSSRPRDKKTIITPYHIIISRKSTLTYKAISKYKPIKR